MPNKIKYQTKKTLSEQRYEVIMAHILDPENYPLPEHCKEQFDRVITAAKLLDDHHPDNAIPLLLSKYNITRNKAREDLKLAQELFKSKHTFDWDFWQSWQIKDLVEIIRSCKGNNKRDKERIAAHKVLKEIIGEKPASVEDPKRMEKNVFYVQLNNNNTIVNVPLDKLKGLSQDEIQIITGALTTPEIEDEDIINIMNT